MNKKNLSSIVVKSLYVLGGATAAYLSVKYVDKLPESIGNFISKKVIEK